MPRVTNEELLRRCQVAAQQAAHLAGLIGAAPRLETVKVLRNKLRCAYCAAQELKTRLKN